MTQCRDGTPSDMLERMLVAFKIKEPEIPHNRASSVLGSGELRNYYEKFLEENGRKAEEKSAEQVNHNQFWIVNIHERFLKSFHSLASDWEG